MRTSSEVFQHLDDEHMDDVDTLTIANRLAMTFKGA